MNFTEDLDSKPLKKGKLGPLDIYPQEEKQREDELTSEFVRSGFRNQIPELLSEYEYQSIGKDQPISTNSNFDNDVIRVLLQIVNKKEESNVNSQIEASKKQSLPAKTSQSFRPSLILMTGNQKTKESAYAWFKQLANNEPLIKLAKKIPVFNKRADNLPEILITLYEYQVSISRSVWYLKIMVLGCTTNLTEANKKKRQTTIDVSSEWSVSLVRLLKEMFLRLQFYELSAASGHQHQSLPANMTLEGFMKVDNLNSILLPIINHNYLTEKKLKCLWTFTTKLTRAMLDQNLLDKQMILESLLDLLEKSAIQNRSAHSNLSNDSFLVNKLLLSTVFQNMYHFLQSELLSRRLAHFCCKRISNLFNEYSNVFFEKIVKQIQQKHNLLKNQAIADPESQLDMAKYIIKNEVPLSSIKALFNKFVQCPLHRDQLIQLISIVHSIQLGCMQACLWNKVGDERAENPYNGSPLDFLPCPPSTLVYTYDYLGVSKQTRDYVRRELEKSELCVKRRSIEIETKWTTDRLKPASIGIVQTKILDILETLDKNCYDLSDINETIETLYSQIFSKVSLGGKKNKKYENFHDLDCVIDEQNEDEMEDDFIESDINKPLSDKEIIHLLCDWATTTRRCGLHRVFYAVFLIKKRQIELVKQVKEFNKLVKKRLRKKMAEFGFRKVVDKRENNRKRKHEDDVADLDDQSDEVPNAHKKIRLEPAFGDNGDLQPAKNLVKNQLVNKIKKKYQPNVSKKHLVNKSVLKMSKLKQIQKKLRKKILYEYPYQKILLDYLDQKADHLPFKQDMNYLVNVNSDNVEFSSVIFLFYMFINCKLFSHDQFVRDLISRGDCFRNNLSDIKRPVNVFMPFKKKQLELKQQQQQQQQQHQQHSQLKAKLSMSRNSIEYPMSVDQHPPASIPAYNPLPHTPQFAPSSVPTPCKSSDALKSNSQLSIRSSNCTNGVIKMSKFAVFVLNLPLPQTQSYTHERNQRFVLLYGFGSKKQEILDKIHSLTKQFQGLFRRKSSIDLNENTTISSLNTNSAGSNYSRHLNSITNIHVHLSQAESDLLSNIQKEYNKMSYYDQYSIIARVNQFVLEVLKNVAHKNYLPKQQFILFVFDLMETNMNVFGLFLFVIKLLHLGPSVGEYLRGKFLTSKSVSSSKSPYFEYLSHFYLNIIGVLRVHLISLVLWKDLAAEVFELVFKLVANVEKPSKCSSHEKCALMLLNDMYTSCGFIKNQFPLFDSIANKIRAEKCFTQQPQTDRNSSQVSYQMKPDDLLNSMITTTDHTVDEIENYIGQSKDLQYNFVAHVFLTLSSLQKDEMFRVANLCAELTSRCNMLITFWQNATKALHYRNTEPNKERSMFNEIINKINIQSRKSKENFKHFLSILASRHCLILNDFIIMVVKTCIMACPKITNEQSNNFSSLEPSASLACHIIHHIFTSSPKPLKYRRSGTDQRMLTANCRSIMFSTFLLVLKCLFIMSDTKRESSSGRKNQSSRSTRDERNDEMDLAQFAGSVLHEICEHDWIKERCFHEGDNLLKSNQLLESALGRSAQNLLHIICYPQSHELRKQNEQTSTKDFIRYILENLNIWTFRESLLEFKLMIELDKQRERYYDFAIDFFAKTTVEFLIDPDIANLVPQTSLLRSASQMDANQDEKEADSQLIKSPLEKNESMQVDNENPEDITEVILAETDLNVELEHNEDVDEFENLDRNQSNKAIGVWLIAPLITKLPDLCQLKTLEHASKSLQELGKAFWGAKNKSEKETQAIKNIIAWNQQPFFSLMLSCLKNKFNNDQHQQQKILLTSLFNGLTDFINGFNDNSQGKDDKILSEDPRIKQIMMDTLHIRLSLVGSMFDFILRNTNDFANWAWLFVQLIYSGVVDPDNDQLLFTIIIDMLTVLIHHIISTEPNIESNRHYQTIIKKISKETKDFSDLPNTKAINFIRKLLPLNRSSNLEIMTVESNCTTVSKTLANLLDKRRGFKFVRKEKVNTWELIEGVKNASALCLSWYGFSKLEKKMLRYEYQQRLLVRHKHMNIHKELSYLKEKPDVPNDLIELPEPVIVETVKKEQKTPMNTSNMKPMSSMNLSMNAPGFMSGDQTKSHVNSPTVGMPNADIVVIGGTVPNQMEMMMQQHSQMPMQPHHPHMHGQPGQAMQQPVQHQMMVQPMAQNHSQIMNRLQNQMQHHQQMHHQQQQQQYPGQGMMMGGNAMQMQPDRKGLTRQMSTPDKQKSANPSLQKKQKSTTPRKNSTSKNTPNAQVSSMQGMQAGMPMQQAKMAPQAQQYVPNQVMAGQGFASNQQVIPRPMSQNPGAIMQPNMAQRMANPPNQSNQYYQAQGQQNPAQFQQQRMPQPGQVAAAGPMPQGANRMPYQPINQAQNPIRKPMPPNQPMPGYQAQMNQTRPMLPQGQPANVPGQQYQSNAQMYSQVNKQQTSIPAPRTVTPDPLAKQNTPSGSQNFMNPQQAVRFPNQQTAQLQHQKQAQQQRLFNTSTPPSNAAGMQMPTQAPGQAQMGQNIGWQQQQQRQQAMQRQAQLPQAPNQQYQQQYMQKQHPGVPMNVQSSQQQQQQQQYMQQQQQRVAQPQQSQQYQNY